MHVPSEPQATDLKAKVDVYMPVDCEWNGIDIRDLAWLSNKVTNILKGCLNLGVTPNLMYCSVQYVFSGGKHDGRGPSLVYHSPGPPNNNRPAQPMLASRRKRRDLNTERPLWMTVFSELNKKGRCHKCAHR